MPHALHSVPPPSAKPPSIRPIPARLEIDERVTGRGVTIGFLDSGFFAHADLVEPESRILAHHDVLTDETTLRGTPPPNASSWHGMMTSVVCAGNGHLSGGKYRGLAPDALVVLVKVGSIQRIQHHAIRDGIRWAIAHREQYGIRVLNISCGGDYEESYLTDSLSRAAEDAVRAGIVVVAAVGNSGRHGSRVLPPASAPSVISVGGFDDTSNQNSHSMYHSSHGPTVDGLQKPELIAQAIWVAAPVLPETPTARHVELLHALANADGDDAVRELLRDGAGIDPELDAIAGGEAYLIRSLVELKYRDQKIVSGHYKHVDGTSFAAPIVSAVVAQMLEANPALTPPQVKKILIDTALRIPGVEVDRQGWGVVQPARAVARALQARL
ncbi:MAG: S8 family serine peptidase [Polyangiaceae bacterium]|nr:S8 family serine peptidase [Polyangiaceae bacterium]